MNALLFTLDLQSPVLITGTGNGEENSSRTLPYLPGAAIRGALISRYLQSNQTNDLLADKRAHRLFFDGKVRYLNAYPVSGAPDERSLPLPASWRKAKDDHWSVAEVVDFALEIDPDKDEPVKQHYSSATMEEDKFVVFDPEEELTIHIASQERGLVRAENNTVFQYQALARDQKFGAAIIAEDMNDLRDVEKLLSQDPYLNLGRSRSARYGRTRIISIQPIDTQANRWIEAPGEMDDSNRPTVITLISDAALRDQYGQFTHDLDSYLSLRLNRQIKCQRAFIRSAISGGFNRKWGMPLPQIPALGMGSCFIYPPGTFSQQELDILVDQGIGERRVDGLGRIAVNWSPRSRFYLKEPTVSFASQVRLSSSSEKIALFMSQRLLRQKLDSELVPWAQRFQIRGNIVNHQLSRLRNILRQTINQRSESVQPVKDFLDKLKKPAEDQFRKARLIRDGGQSGPRLLSWLSERLSALDGLQLMNFNENDIPEVVGQKAEITNDIKREYTLRLIESIVDSRMKQNRKEGKS